MPYTKQTWANGPGGGTPESATRLGYMETGIYHATGGGFAPPAGRIMQLGGSIENSGFAPGGTSGTEHALWTWFPEITIDQLGTFVETGSSDSGSILLLGLRPISPLGIIGAPVVQGSATITGSQGAHMATVTSTTLAPGMYAVCWAKVGDASNTWRSMNFSIRWLFPMASGTSAPAQGHGPWVATLSTSNTTTLPNTEVTPADQSTNSGYVPALLFRRASS